MARVMYEQRSNIISLANMFLGFFAILLIFQSKVEAAVLAILFAAILDGLDGFTARLFGIESITGRHLDSLADLVSFGVAPAVLVYHLNLDSFGLWGTGIAAFYVVCAGYRLARFSACEQPSNYFTGLPSTMAGCMLAALGFLGAGHLTHILPATTLVLAVLMISNLRYMKQDNFAKWHIILCVLALAFLAIALRPSVRFLAFPLLATYLAFGLMSLREASSKIRKWIVGLLPSQIEQQRYSSHMFRFLYETVSSRGGIKKL